MATVNKDFKIKSGLIVEGANGTINGYDILTKDTADQNYIIGLIGGSATSAATPDTVVLRDGTGSFSATTVTADLVGDVTGQVSDISNHDTGDLAEGSNLYFTSARAVTANEGLWDTVGSASAAQTAAEAYADTVGTNTYNSAVTAAANDATTKMQQAESYADQSALDAQNAAENYADGLISTEVTNRNNAISTAISTEVTDRDNAISTAITNLNLGGTYDALGAADAALVDAKAYTDAEVAALVDSAPAMLDTLNELAAAIADNPNYATDVANLVATKADTSYVNSEISDLDTAAQGYATTAENNAKSYADGLAVNYDAAGSASTAQTNAQNYADTVALNAKNDAKSYADSLAVNYDAAGSASTAQTNAENYADTVATSAENAAKSYADSLAVNYDPAGSASSAETAANTYTDNAITNLNLATTYDAYGAAATAEANANGYTDIAISNGDNTATPTYAGVNFTWATKQTGAYAWVSTASIAQVFQWTNYPTAKFVVRVRAGVHSQVSEVLLTTDDNGNIAITEYGIVSTNGSLGTVSATYDAGTWTLTVETTENNSEVIVAATLMAYGD